MPRGDKGKAALLEEIRSLTKDGMPESAEELLSLINKKAIEAGLEKPSIDKVPELKEAAEKLSAWCAENNKRILIDDGGVKIKSVREKKEKTEEAEA